MASKAVLTCRPNSHPFQDRVLVLDQPVKIGRSVARARSTPNNAIFDCKVLSRNHALFWYSNGKFYLQDTKSSNGTFINNQRLSKSGEESTPREVCSGDIVQFGVDVLENTRKVTHGCIIANIKLYLPDGKEAKPSVPVNGGLTPGSHSVEDLYQLNQFIQEAVQRELMLEDKLATLQSVFDNIKVAADQGWKALITEDKLLSRVENLENLLQTYSKEYSEDQFRDQLRKLHEDKDQYQQAAKDFLYKVLEEKVEANKKYQEIKRSLVSVEAEYSNLCSEMVKTHNEMQELAQKYSMEVSKNDTLQAKYNELEEQHQKVLARLDKDIYDKEDKEEFITDSLEKEKELGDEESEEKEKWRPELCEEVQLRLVSQIEELARADCQPGVGSDPPLSDYEPHTRSDDEDSVADCWSETTVGEDNERELRNRLEEAMAASERYRRAVEDLCAGGDQLRNQLHEARKEVETRAATVATLQEQLVTVETRYMACVEERASLAQQLRSSRPPSNLSFLYIVFPLVLALLAFLYARPST